MSSGRRLRRRSRLRLASFSEAVQARIWPLPTAAIIVAVALGIVLPVFDAGFDDRLPASVGNFLFSGGPESARSVLSAIAGSLITATSLTFSLTVVALQLGSSQASPRVLRMFARDRNVHITMAVFLGTFAFALTVLRTVRDKTAADVAFVPRLSVTLAFLLTLASVITLTFFLAHLARQLRIETMLRDVHNETDRTIALVTAAADGDAPQEPSPAGDRHWAHSSSSGFITSVDRERLLAMAVHFDVVIEEEHPIGSIVILEVPIASWWSHDPAQQLSHEQIEAVQRGINSAFAVGYERTSSQDIGFGLRQMVDIGIKALSPGINDPTTAVHALGHISAVLCTLGRLPRQRLALRDDDGRERVRIRPHNFVDLLELGVEQPRRYGVGDPDVVARLYQLLREVGYVVTRADEREAVRAQHRRLDDAVASADFDQSERERFAAAARLVDLALDGRWASRTE
ncbi:MAG: DUF2254 domain-containing protein [Pseudolysinimonas sp.]